MMFLEWLGIFVICGLLITVLRKTSALYWTNPSSRSRRYEPVLRSANSYVGDHRHLLGRLADGLQ
jgi:hypothetical protein